MLKIFNFISFQKTNGNRDAIVAFIKQLNPKYLKGIWISGYTYSENKNIDPLTFENIKSSNLKKFGLIHKIFPSVSGLTGLDLFELHDICIDKNIMFPDSKVIKLKKVFVNDKLNFFSLFNPASFDNLTSLEIENSFINAWNFSYSFKNVEYLSIKNHSFVDNKLISIFKGVKKLDISGNKIEDPSNVFRHILRYQPNLETLILEKIKGIKEIDFSGYKNLKYISIVGSGDIKIKSKNKITIKRSKKIKK